MVVGVGDDSDLVKVVIVLVVIITNVVNREGINRDDACVRINIWKAGDQYKVWGESVGKCGSHWETQVSRLLGPCVAPRPDISARGRVGGGRAEPEGW